MLPDNHLLKANRLRCAERQFEALAIGCSAGGLDALRIVLGGLPADMPIAVIVVAHTTPDGEHLLPSLLSKISKLPVCEATERESIVPGTVYIAPPNYHLLVEPERRFALSVDERVCFVRPAIDVLFCSAADVYRQHLIGMILTGANNDGAEGLKAIKAAGGYTLVQDPRGAFADTMPRAAINGCQVDSVLALEALAMEVQRLCFSHIPT